MASAAKEILTDLSPVIKVYTDGTVERLINSPNVLPSPEDPDTGVATKDSTISAALSARLYLPKLTSTSTQKLPIFLYFHGGGFVVGSAFSLLDRRCLNLIAAASGALLISVDYRLAPEHPLPAAYDDCWDSLRWVCSHSPAAAGFEMDEWIAKHGDFSRVFIGGDSSGGNIAHNLAMWAGSDPLPGNVKINGAILSFPYFWGSNPVGDEPKEDIEQSLLYRLGLFAYPSAGGGIDDPAINPVAAGAPSLSGLGCSKILVCTAEKDVLRGRNRIYAERVKSSGWKGEVEVVEVAGEGHCFHVFDGESEKARTLIDRIANFISH